MARRTSRRTNVLMDLPDSLIMNISVRVAKVSLSDTIILVLVCSKFNRNYKSEEVLSECSLEESRNFYRFMWKLCKKGNGQALYQIGIVRYFGPWILRRQEEGLNLLTRSADKGIPKSAYLVGLILICVGGERKREGYERLARLKKLKLSSTIEEVGLLRTELKDTILWRYEKQGREVLASYVNDGCGCKEEEGAEKYTMWLLKFAYRFGKYHEDVPLLHRLCSMASPPLWDLKTLFVPCCSYIAYGDVSTHEKECIFMTWFPPPRDFEHPQFVSSLFSHALVFVRFVGLIGL